MKNNCYIVLYNEDNKLRYGLICLDDSEPDWEYEIEKRRDGREILYVAKLVPFPNTFQPFTNKKYESFQSVQKESLI